MNVSKSRFLAVVLTGLAMVKGGQAFAAEQYVAPGQGTQIAARGTYQASSKTAPPRAASTGKTSVGIQDQVTVTSKGTPVGKNTGFQGPLPTARSRYIVKEGQTAQPQARPRYIVNEGQIAKPQGRPRYAVNSIQMPQLSQSQLLQQ